MRRLLPDYAVRRHKDEEQVHVPGAHVEAPLSTQEQARLKAGGKAVDGRLLTKLQRAVGNRIARRLTQGEAFAAPAEVERELADHQGRGSPLEGGARTQMEQSLGAELSAVRIHRDADAARLTQQLEARAFTHVNDIYFGSGEFAPDTHEGRRVLAHELAHVMQQRSGAKLMVGAVNDPAEREADEMAERVTRRLAQGEIARQEGPEEEEETAQMLRRQPEEEEEETAQALHRQVTSRGMGILQVHAPLPAQAWRAPARRGAAGPGRITNRAGGTDYYTLAGDTLADVYALLDPDEWGRCTVHYAVAYTAIDGVITAANITVTDSYRMPRWRGRGYNRASRAAKAEWQRMVNALWTHEHGHRDIGRREAATIQAGLVGQAEGDFTTRLAELEAAAQALQDAYDVQTQHGQTQGVSLDTSIE
jgi:hypothetical protein